MTSTPEELELHSQRLPDVVLREPAHLVSPKAVQYWRAQALIMSGVVMGLVAVAAFILRGHMLLVVPIAAVLVALCVAWVVAMPRVRFRVHRWEVTDIAIYTRSGWINRTTLVVPLSRVQTVDSEQGPLMRVYGLAAVTVATASSGARVSIAGLSQEVAHEVVRHLVKITGAQQGDAT